MHRILCLVLLTVWTPAARAAEGHVDILRLLIPGATTISWCKPQELIEIGEKFEMETGDAVDDLPAEAITDEIFAGGWEPDGGGFLYIYGIDSERAGDVESLDKWKYRETRGGFTVLRSGRGAHDWESALILHSRKPVYYWGSAAATDATLSNLDDGEGAVEVLERLQNLRDIRSNSQCLLWAELGPRAIEELEPESGTLSARLLAILAEHLFYRRINRTSLQVTCELTVDSETQLPQVRRLIQEIAGREDELLFDEAEEFIEPIVEMFYLGSVTIETSGRTLKLSMTGPKDEIRKAGDELDREREKRGLE